MIPQNTSKVLCCEIFFFKLTTFSPESRFFLFLFCGLSMFYSRQIKTGWHMIPAGHLVAVLGNIIALQV